MHSAVIVSAARTAIGKAPRGTLRTTRPEEMAAAVIGAVVERAPAVDPQEIDDVIMGCAMPEAEQGMNVARIASLRAGRPGEAVPSTNVLSACASSNAPGRAASTLARSPDVRPRCARVSRLTCGAPSNDDVPTT